MAKAKAKVGDMTPLDQGGREMTEQRRRCEHCGCVVHKRGGVLRHYGSNEACLRIRGLLFAIAAIDDPRAKATLANWYANISEESL